MKKQFCILSQPFLYNNYCNILSSNNNYMVFLWCRWAKHWKKQRVKSRLWKENLFQNQKLLIYLKLFVEKKSGIRKYKANNNFVVAQKLSWINFSWIHFDLQKRNVGSTKSDKSSCFSLVLCKKKSIFFVVKRFSISKVAGMIFVKAKFFFCLSYVLFICGMNHSSTFVINIFY